MSDNKQMVEGWLVKYALSKGIVPCVGELCGEYVSIRTHWWTYYKIGKDFFYTKIEAEAAAIAMAERKIASLEKQLAKMQELARKPKWWEAVS